MEQAIAKKKSAGVSPSTSAVSSKEKKERWKSEAESFLLDWMETDGNFDRYRSAAVPHKGRKRTDGVTKVGISQEISKYLDAKGFKRTDQQVRTKIENYLKQWKNAHKVKSSTGFGVNLKETDVRGSGVNF